MYRDVMLIFISINAEELMASVWRGNAVVEF